MSTEIYVHLSLFAVKTFPLSKKRDKCRVKQEMRAKLMEFRNVGGKVREEGKRKMREDKFHNSNTPSI